MSVGAKNFVQVTVVDIFCEFLDDNLFDQLIGDGTTLTISPLSFAVLAIPCSRFENSSDLAIRLWRDSGSYSYHFSYHSALTNSDHGCFLGHFEIVSENRSVVILSGEAVNVHGLQLAIGLYPGRRNESATDPGNGIEMALVGFKKGRRIMSERAVCRRMRLGYDLALP